MRVFLILGASLALPLTACSEAADGTDEATATDQVAVTIPESLAPFGDGYPASGDPCLRLGESAATSNYLDDSAVLVGCPTEADAEALGGTVVGNVDGVRLVSVAMGDANAGMGENGPAVAETAAAAPAAAASVPIRGANSLETRCANRVADTTGARVIGTNRIEESEAAIAIYINVDGATAPWRCLAYRDGSIGEVMFTGDEGAL